MIEVKENVFWDETAQRQSGEAMQWLCDDVLPRMACTRTELDKVQPVYDAHNRPYEWCITMPTCLVTITREYVRPNSSSWAMKKDTITVTTKTE